MTREYHCERCNVTVVCKSAHLRSKKHDPEKYVLRPSTRKPYHCERCNVTVADKSSHEKSKKHDPEKYVARPSTRKPYHCEQCNVTVAYKYTHLKTKKHEHNDSHYSIDGKDVVKLTKTEIEDYKSRGFILQGHKIFTPGKPCDVNFKNFTEEFCLAIVNDMDVEKQLEALRLYTKIVLNAALVRLAGIKFKITMVIVFSKPDPEGGDDLTSEFCIAPKMLRTITTTDEIEPAIEDMYSRIKLAIDKYSAEGSGWVVDKIKQHKVSILAYNPLVARSYVKLPDYIQNKKATINIKNDDDKCLVYCLARALDPNPETINLERVSKHLKRVVVSLGLDKIQCPVKIDTTTFTQLENNFNLSINLFGHKAESIYPIIITKKTDGGEHVNLLLTSNDEGVNHYVWIKNFDKLCNDITNHKEPKFFCYNCINHFPSEESLVEHRKVCIVVNGKQAVKMPKPNSFIEAGVVPALPPPFVIYADFESCIVPCTDGKETEHTTQLDEHVPCSFCYKVICPLDDSLSKPLKLYRGENAVYKFCEAILEEEECLHRRMDDFKKSKPILTKKDLISWNEATTCHICGNYFGDGENDAENDAEKCIGPSQKVRDHCHVTGKYRGAACNRCNLHLKLPNFIPVIFHNLTGYDGHLIMQELGKFNRPISVIPLNMEKYMTFSVSRSVTNKKTGKSNLVPSLKFIDSFRFQSASLSKLVDSLKESGLGKFQFTSQIFQDNLDLMTRKGVYPYKFIDSLDKFNVKLASLKIDDFNNDLTGEAISEDDFKFFQNVSAKFGLTTLGEYHDLYLKSDVLLLADVFENFRSNCQNHYKLDACNFVSAPGLSWAAMLKYTKVKLELISEVDMHLFVERGKRGGLSVITGRHAEANNKFMKHYNSDKPSKYITYLDANNLYGWAMSQPLPVGNYKWIDPAEYDINNTDKSKGYFLEVDLEYPASLHDEHNDYPFCAEALVITENMLSEYTKTAGKKHDIRCGKIPKLVATLHDKKNYVMHECALLQAIHYGLKLRKIHRVLQFDQSPWLKPYIDFNTEKRKMASNEVTKDFFKLMNNSVYGKTMENLRNRTNIKLVTTDKIFKKYTTKPTLVNFKVFNENLIGLHLINEQIELRAPVQIGIAVLEISKTLMYQFHYNFIKRKYGNNVKLLFTDTDSLCYEISTEDVYRDMHDDQKWFDLSDIKLTEYKDDRNKKRLGKFKDEMTGIPIREFVGLRSKMYSILYGDDGKEKKVAKGVVRSVIKNKLRHAQYKSTLDEMGVQQNSMKTIKSQLHHLYTVNLRKRTLCSYDDKRYVLDNGCDTLAHGHYRIPTDKN